MSSELEQGKFTLAEPGYLLNTGKRALTSQSFRNIVETGTYTGPQGVLSQEVT